MPSETQNRTETTKETEVPAGMSTVSEQEFFSRLYADKRDIMPSVLDPYVTDWETRDRRRVGRSLPGWRNSGEPKVWMWSDSQS